MGDPHYTPDLYNYYEDYNNFIKYPIHPITYQRLENRSRFVARELGPALPIATFAGPLAIAAVSGYQTYNKYLSKQREVEEKKQREEEELRKIRNVDRIRMISAYEKQRKALKKDMQDIMEKSIVPYRQDNTNYGQKYPQYQEDIGQTARKTYPQYQDNISIELPMGMPIEAPPKPIPPPPKNIPIELTMPQFTFNLPKKIYKLPQTGKTQVITSSFNRLIKEAKQYGVEHLLNNPVNLNEPALKFFTKEGFREAVLDVNQYVPERAFELGGVNFKDRYTRRINTISALSRNADDLRKFQRKNLKIKEGPIIEDVNFDTAAGALLVGRLRQTYPNFGPKEITVLLRTYSPDVIDQEIRRRLSLELKKRYPEYDDATIKFKINDAAERQSKLY